MLSCGAWTSATPRALTTGGSTIGCSVPVIIIININTIAIIIVVAVIILIIIVVVIIAMSSSLSLSSIIHQTMQCTLLSILILMHCANTNYIVQSVYQLN